MENFLYNYKKVKALLLTQKLFCWSPFPTVTFTSICTIKTNAFFSCAAGAASSRNSTTERNQQTNITTIATTENPTHHHTKAHYPLAKYERRTTASSSSCTRNLIFVSVVQCVSGTSAFTLHTSMAFVFCFPAAAVAIEYTSTRFSYVHTYVRMMYVLAFLLHFWKYSTESESVCSIFFCECYNKVLY